MHGYSSYSHTLMKIIIHARMVTLGRSNCSKEITNDSDSVLCSITLSTPLSNFQTPRESVMDGFLMTARNTELKKDRQRWGGEPAGV